MASKVSGVDGSRPASLGAGRVAQRTQNPAAPVVPPAPVDVSEVHITDAASQLAALEHAVYGLPAVDETRVAAISSAIDQGTYSVAPDHVATKLMLIEQSLGALPGEPT